MTITETPSEDCCNILVCKINKDEIPNPEIFSLVFGEVMVILKTINNSPTYILTILLLCLLLIFFDWEDISTTRDSVSSAIKTPQISSKILRCASYFQLSSRCLDILMKQCHSRLIYFFIGCYSPCEFSGD